MTGVICCGAYIAAVNAVVAGAPDGMTIGIHVCRSQDPSWQADAGYDPIAEPLFNEMKVGIYFLEYDNARAGDFAPLRAVPAGQIRRARPGRLQSSPRWRAPSSSSGASRRRAVTSSSSNSA